MANTLKIAPDLYSNQPRTAIPGARHDFRKIALLTTDEITTQIIALGILPAGHRLNGVVVECDQLDTLTTMTMNVGILNAYYDTPTTYGAYNSGGVADTTATPVLVAGQNILTASTIGQTGGRASAATLAFTSAIGVDNTKDRIVGIQFPAAGSGVKAGNLYLGLTIDED